jgi:hypothetical protein
MTIVRNLWGALRWAIEARVARIMHPRETPDHSVDSGKKTKINESPAATLENEMKRTRGRSG